MATFEELLYKNITSTNICDRYKTGSGKIKEYNRQEKIFRINARLIEVFKSKKGATCIRYIPYSVFSTSDSEIFGLLYEQLKYIQDPKPNIICINKKYDITKILREYEHNDLLRNIVNIKLIVKITKYNKNKFYIDILREPKIKYEGEDTFITDLDKHFNNNMNENNEEEEYNEYEDENEGEQIYNDIN